MIPLVNLARDVFSKLSNAELTLIRTVETPEIAWCGSSTEEGDPTNRTANAGSWTKERTVRADLIVWLITDPIVSARIHYSGLGLGGARIDGPLDLSNLKTDLPLTFRNCFVPGRMSFVLLKMGLSGL